MNGQTDQGQAVQQAEQRYLATIELFKGGKDFHECTGDNEFDARQKAGWAYVRVGRVTDVVALGEPTGSGGGAPAQLEANQEEHPVYNKRNYPTLLFNHGNWDIYTNARGHCAAIPSREGAGVGCKATHFGDMAYVKTTLPAEYAAWEARQREPLKS